MADMSLFGRLLARNDSQTVRPLASGTRNDVSSNRGTGRFVNHSTGQGTTLDRHTLTGYEPPPRLLISEIDALIEFCAIARRIVRREADDAFREGYSITGYSAEQLKVIRKSADRLGITTSCKDARSWARAYGGGAVLMIIDDGMPFDQPVNWPGITKLRAVKAVDKNQLTVMTYNTDPLSPDFSEPLMYNLSLADSSVVTGRVHADRVAVFQGTKLPDRVERARGGWGGSVLDLVWAELRNWLSSNEGATEALTKLSQGVFKSKYLADAMGAGDMQKAAERVEALSAGLGLLGDMILDKENEEYTIHQRNLAGLKDTLGELRDSLGSAVDMPAEIMFNKTPGGMNSGASEGPIRIWYDHVASQQPELYTPPLTKVLKVLLHSSEGPIQGQVAPGWEVTWPSLWQLTDGEAATIRLQDAQARVNDASSGAVSGDELRQDPDFREHYDIDPTLPAPQAQTAVGPTGAPTTIATPMTESDESAFPPGENLVPLSMAAVRMGTGKGAIMAMIRRKDIPAAKAGNVWRVAMSQVIAAAAKAGAMPDEQELPPDPMDPPAVH